MRWVVVTVIIMQISAQIGLDWNWPTGTELGNIYDPYSFSFNRNRIFQNGIPIRFNRIRIFHFSVPFKRKRIQYFNRIIRLNRISNYLTEFGPNNSVQPNIRSFGQIKRN